MTKTAIIYAQKYLDHNTGPTHPESPKRLKVIMEELKSSRVIDEENCKIFEPDQARRNDVELVHHADYIELVNRTCSLGGGLLDHGDTEVSPDSYEVALYAVGGVLKAIDLVLVKKVENAFAFVRPPGHHAGPYTASGFCIFNNIAVGAKHLLQRFNFDRVLILDVDAHHGNGTQEIFYDTDKVLFISLHQDPRGFPGTGFVDEIGEKDGLGYSVNIPLPYKTGDDVYKRAFEELVTPIVKQYRPQFILVSAGFDGHYNDPVASLSLTVDGYARTFRFIREYAASLCQGKLVAVLEGGYSLRFIGKIAACAVAEMAGVSYSFADSVPQINSAVTKQGEKVIEEVKKIQSTYWKLG
ncbi:MAG: histone deacetylase family protein [Candidatus Bathyarchaeales archaeon]